MMQHPEIDEDFLKFESKVHQVMKLLQDVSGGGGDADDDIVGDNTKEKSGDVGQTVPQRLQDIDEENFVVTCRQNRTVINKRDDATVKAGGDNNKSMSMYGSDGPAALDKFTFMQQIEKDAEERTKARLERERISQNFRSLGNNEFRKGNFEKAIMYYTKAIEQIKDSPILYNNRALSYIKLKNYKRAIIDCDFVLNKLEEKNLRAWLYRAVAYKRLDDEPNYETCIKFARKHNSKQSDYIDNFIKKLNDEF